MEAYVQENEQTPEIRVREHAALRRLAPLNQKGANEGTLAGLLGICSSKTRSLWREIRNDENPAQAVLAHAAHCFRHRLYGKDGQPLPATTSPQAYHQLADWYAVHVQPHMN